MFDETKKSETGRSVKKPIKGADNQYTLVCEGGKYFAIFRDGEGKRVEQELTEAIYLQMEEWRKEDVRHEREALRHLEYSELTDESIERRAAKKSESVEEYIEHQKFVQMIEQEFLRLDETQQRRVLLRLDNQSLTKIAAEEGCSRPAIFYAMKTIQKKFENFYK